MNTITVTKLKCDRCQQDIEGEQFHGQNLVFCKKCALEHTSEIEPIDYVIGEKSDIDFQIYLEAIGKGMCDSCRCVRDIGRGENFAWHEEDSEWHCLGCQAKHPTEEYA